MQLYVGLIYGRLNPNLKKPEGVTPEEYAHAAYILHVLRDVEVNREKWFGPEKKDSFDEEDIFELKNRIVKKVVEGVLPLEALEEVVDPDDFYYEEEVTDWRE